jgi:hypothetical protein
MDEEVGMEVRGSSQLPAPSRRDECGCKTVDFTLFAYYCPDVAASKV